MYFPACKTWEPKNPNTYYIDEASNLIENHQYYEAESVLSTITDYDEEVERLKNLCQAGICFTNGDYDGGFQYMFAVDGYVIVDYDTNGGDNYLTPERIDSSNQNVNDEATRDGSSYSYWEVIDHQIFPELNKANLSLLAHYSDVY